MCTLCEKFQPWADDCFYPGLGSTPQAGGGSSDDGEQSGLPTYTYDQIADFLTEGYWGTGNSRSFDASPGDTLYVDITELNSAGQDMARAALDAWSVVTGFTFQEVESESPANNTTSETSDAAPGTSTGYSMNIGDDFLGTLSIGSDQDAVALMLTAGQTVYVSLTGEGSGGTQDPYMWILNSSGSVIAENDDANGRDSAISFQASYSGVHYIRAGSYANSYAGDYRISVRETSLTTDIVFADNNSGAYASSSVVGNTIQSSYINVNSNWAGGANRIDGYYYQTYVHEIGHALGLGHAGPYNGSAIYGQDNIYTNDSWQASVMSYFHQTENTSTDDSFAYVTGPQVADIIAIQNLYGTPASAMSGDTTYGDGANTGTYMDTAHSLSNPVSYTVYDTDGTDTFDFSSYTSHQFLDLRQEQYSDLAGYDGNVGIARGAVIENGLTGGGNDTITGNDADNGLSAGSGTDTVDGGSGNDAIRGGAGSDDLNGEDGFDLVEGGTGNNLIDGGGDGDFLVGDTLTLDILAIAFPSWVPPAGAQGWLDDGDYYLLWDDILDDQGIA